MGRSYGQVVSSWRIAYFHLIGNTCRRGCWVANTGGAAALATLCSDGCLQRPDLQVVEGDQAEVELGVVVAAEETEVGDLGFAAF